MGARYISASPDGQPDVLFRYNFLPVTHCSKEKTALTESVSAVGCGYRKLSFCACC